MDFYSERLLYGDNFIIKRVFKALSNVQTPQDLDFNDSNFNTNKNNYHRVDNHTYWSKLQEINFNSEIGKKTWGLNYYDKIELHYKNKMEEGKRFCFPQYPNKWVKGNFNRSAPGSVTGGTPLYSSLNKNPDESYLCRNFYEVSLKFYKKNTDQHAEKTISLFSFMFQKEVRIKQGKDSCLNKGAKIEEDSSGEKKCFGYKCRGNVFYTYYENKYKQEYCFSSYRFNADGTQCIYRYPGTGDYCDVNHKSLEPRKSNSSSTCF